MLPFEDRHSRQRRLPEVGAHGQRRLDGATATLSRYPGADVERQYLERAGFARVTDGADEPPPAFPFEAQFRFEAARSVARGAWAALERIRRELGIAPGPGPEGES